MGSRKGHHLCNSGMIHKHVIHFTRGNLFTPAIDDLLETSRDEKVSIGIQKSLVTSPEPTISEGTVVGRWIVLVTLGDVCTTDDNLALLPREQQVPHFVHNGNLWTRRHTH